jgi:hypothetical protein
VEHQNVPLLRRQVAETASRLGAINLKTLSKEAQAVPLVVLRDVSGGCTPM